MQINEITALREDPELIAKFQKFVQQIIAVYNKAKRDEIQTFVQNQVLELTRMRANMPNDQLTREITKRAIAAGINKDMLGPPEATANLIKELVPTIDRQAKSPEISTDTGTLKTPGTDTVGIDAKTTANGTSRSVAPKLPGQEVDQKPEVDSAVVAANDISKFQQAYGTGSDGQLPTLFRDKFLNPALGRDLKSAPFVALAKELEGQIPPTVASVVKDRIIKWHGGDAATMKADIQSLIPDKGNPEIDDQIKALEIMIKLITKLDKDIARK